MIYSNNSPDAIRELELRRTDSYGEASNEPVYICASCGGEIFDGEDCLDCNDGMYCRRCIEAMTSDDVVELLGFNFNVASTKDKDF